MSGRSKNKPEVNCDVYVLLCCYVLQKCSISFSISISIDPQNLFPLTVVSTKNYFCFTTRINGYCKRQFSRLLSSHTENGLSTRSVTFKRAPHYILCSIERDSPLAACLYGEISIPHYGSQRLMNIFDTKDLEYNQKVDDRHRCNWKEGDWTDDSDQMILILRTLVQNGGKFDEKDFAKKLRHWVRHGYEELGDTGGCGLGRTTASVLSHRDFLKNPHKAAKDVWEGSGRFIAPNGGVMRTSVLGTMEFPDLNKVIENTRSACMVTHADPRCIASCVAVTIAIALMLQREYVFNNGEHDINAIMSTAHWYAEQELKETPQYKDELKHHMFAESIDKLELDSPRAIGYTFKCMGAGFWAFRQKDFREAIQAITMEAGDADTNCAVAGALLGCKVGFRKLPKSWVKGLCHRGWLDKEIKSYFTLLGLQH
ncbi:Hypothetical predicted protein [Paramuricea clavata]|uniref:Uncharacterized protein n=1 Tax=Paramuricea clavata TaxID=317549 RepID=A0A6S7FZI8_PARCT|nr:Hypothetical predicted protein [Paramuricea clavata]